MKFIQVICLVLISLVLGVLGVYVSNAHSCASKDYAQLYNEFNSTELRLRNWQSVSYEVLDMGTLLVSYTLILDHESLGIRAVDRRTYCVID